MLPPFCLPCLNFSCFLCTDRRPHHHRSRQLRKRGSSSCPFRCLVAEGPALARWARWARSQTWPTVTAIWAKCGSWTLACTTEVVLLAAAELRQRRLLRWWRLLLLRRLGGLDVLLVRLCVHSLHTVLLLLHVCGCSCSCHLLLHGHLLLVLLLPGWHC